MMQYIVKRLLLVIPTLLGITLMLFAVVRFAPGLTSSGGALSGGKLKSNRAQQEEKRIMERRLHLVDASGKPISLPMQYVLWLRDTCEGNFGTSLQYDEPVMTLIRQRLPVTLDLNLISLLVVYLVAVPGGMLAAVQRGRIFDRSFNFGALVLYALPTIWVGSSLVGFLANPQYLDWFPAAGIHSTNTENMTYFQSLGDYLWHIMLAVVCLSYGGFAYLSRQVQASMLDNMRQDYVRTARAKGLKNSTVMIRHVFRNSLLPLITISAGILPGMLGGSVIVEKIFSIHGMGLLGYSATFSRDLPVIQTVALIGSVLTLLSYLITDICYALADPRVSYD